MNSLYPTKSRTREFTKEDWEADLERSSTYPAALSDTRHVVNELLERPDMMDFLENLVDVARHTRGSSAQVLLEEWEDQVEPLLNDPYGLVNK